MTASKPPVQHQHFLRETLARTTFVKITGPTGDWIVFYDTSTAQSLTEAQVIALCNRRSGIGAVGVVAVTSEQQPTADVTYRMAAWQANGQPAHNVTEPARAATCVLAVLNKIPLNETSHHVFDTAVGVVTTVYTPSYIGVDIGQWCYTAPETAEAAGSDVFVMAAGLTDPRPGLSLQLENTHITIAVESEEELENIDLNQQPSIEPAVTSPTSVSFVTPQDPLLQDGMGQLKLRHHSDESSNAELASACAAATVAFQTWAGLKQLNIWKVTTPHGDIVVQLHEQHRLSTFAKLSSVFFGQL